MTDVRKVNMLSLIEVRCPHCGAQGQIMLPPLGAIIVGPCPECHNMVVIFAGKVLPLDNDIMHGEDADAKRSHLLKVLGEFLEDRITRLVGEPESLNAPKPKEGEGLHSGKGQEDEGAPALDPFGNASTAPISSAEVDSFVNVDLEMLDDKEYFRMVFG